MRILNINDFSRMKLPTEESMTNIANLIGYTLTYDDYGAEVKTPVTTSGVKCGFSYARTYDINSKSWLSTGNEANLRLPIGTAFDCIDDVVIVSGVAASGMWHVNGQPQIGNTCILVNLTKGVY